MKLFLFVVVFAAMPVGSAPASVKVVDIYGVPTDKAVDVKGNTFAIGGRYQTYYYEVKR